MDRRGMGKIQKRIGPNFGDPSTVEKGAQGSLRGWGVGVQKGGGMQERSFGVET